MVKTGGWRYLLLVTIPLFHAAILLWWIAMPKLRLHLYRFYYLVFGPRCDVQVLGTVFVEPTLCSEDVLNQVLSVAKEWRPDAKETLRVTNRSVIQAGPRTLTVTIPTPSPMMVEESEVVQEDAPLPEQEVNLDLRGYDTKLTQMDSLLHREVQALLERFTAIVCKPGRQANFSLRLRVNGTNPFLAFYLREVPTGHVDQFQLRLTENEFGSLVDVTVTANQLSVAAHSPSALVSSTRRYLATPALANLN